MENYEAENRAFFETYDPALLNELEPSSDTEVVPSRRGGLTMTLAGRFVHGKYNPQRDAEKLLEKSESTPTGLHLHFGFGLGYLLRADRTLKGGSTIIFEPDRAIAAAAITHVPLADLFRERRARLCCNADRFRNLLRELLLPGETLRVVINPFHQNAYPEALNQFAVTIKREQNRKKITESKGVKHIFRGFLASTLRSLPHTTRLPGINRLADAFKNTPAVIVAAGPSLEKNLTQLVPIRKKALIFTIARSVRILERLGISPHFLVQTESKNWMRLIEGCGNLQKTTFLLADQCHHSYFEYPSKYTFCYQNPGNAVTKWLLQHYPQLQRRYLATAGSVATEAFSLALVLGCNPIILVGQDLAVSKARYYAAAPTNKAFNHKKTDLSLTAGYFGAHVPTISNYLYFIAWYEDALKTYKERHPDRIFINATEGGAAIKGFRNMKMAEAIHRYINKPVDPQPVLLEASRIPKSKTLTSKALADLMNRVGKELIEVRSQAQMFRTFESGLQQDLETAGPHNLNRIQGQLQIMEQFHHRFLNYCRDLQLLVGFCDEKFRPGTDQQDYQDIPSLAAALKVDLASLDFNYRQLDLAAERLQEVLAALP